MPGEIWRLLVTGPLDGATNMAVDEALLQSRIAGDTPPTVRFFGWAPPTLSLGYGQPLDDRIDLVACRSLGIGLVRRPTGGSAILHESPDREVTYSVVARGGDFVGADDVLETYRILGAGLMAGLARLGVHAELVPLVRAARGPAFPTFCFARAGAYEIAAQGRKLVGSAQRRQAGAFLQHGSILLDADADRLRAVFPGASDPAARVGTLTGLCGRRITFDEVVSAVAAGLADVLGSTLQPGPLTPLEIESAQGLVTAKYGTTAWTHRGQIAAFPDIEAHESPSRIAG